MTKHCWAQICLPQFRSSGSAGKGSAVVEEEEEEEVVEMMCSDLIAGLYRLYWPKP